MRSYGGCSSAVESLTVDQVVVGSNPTTHPKPTPLIADHELSPGGIAPRIQVMDRTNYPTRLILPGQSEPPEDLRRTTPEERIEMMWDLVLDAWVFMGKPLDESRLPRHVVRVVRGGR